MVVASCASWEIDIRPPRLPTTIHYLPFTIHPQFDLPARVWHKSVSKAHARTDAAGPRARRLLSMAKRAQRYLSRLWLHLERAKQRIRRSGFSNFDEERLLEGFVSELMPEGGERVAVDIGAGDGVRGSNTYALFVKGWRGVGFEGDERRAGRLARASKNFEGVAARQALVTP